MGWDELRLEVLLMASQWSALADLHFSAELNGQNATKLNRRDSNVFVKTVRKESSFINEVNSNKKTNLKDEMIGMIVIGLKSKLGNHSQTQPFN
jgi:hypothetical protein